MPDPRPRTALPAQCSGAAITPALTLNGAFPEALSGAYLMLPFEVPPGTTQVRIKYCWESGNTVDLGIWQARDGDAPWAEPQFRGWGGSIHPDVAISAQGFSSEEEHPEGDGQADFRVEIELSSDPAFAADPYQPAPYDETAANPSPGADLRFSVTGDEGGAGIMGDAIPDRSGTLRAEVLNVPEGELAPLLRLYHDGLPMGDVPVPPRSRGCAAGVTRRRGR